eukprot:CAMPEP_0175967618 /NCGR_PEP_ID=MMETSP0108-20121206/39410_1 /TAXON_ID=195067 ORGANISM="Goniomonas pacifica, Strain CCMP1869" /NCGR_SAMPLE_ID=MMETSP0108 /ASSEMBLY_ACC=CAM_ASM_000204 /LENGTH=74 /DNA_ID=CAMNT_0017296117 /DNA_START=182 /DNA_END=403 /DNA_ORIENTATION=-
MHVTTCLNGRFIKARRFKMFSTMVACQSATLLCVYMAEVSTGSTDSLMTFCTSASMNDLSSGSKSKPPPCMLSP